MKRYLMLFCLISIVFFKIQPAFASENPSGVDLDYILDKIEKQYAGADFSANFFQETTLSALDVTDTATGKLTVKHPDKMRWEYMKPDSQIIITDGFQMWIYRPDDNQVMIGKAPDFFADGRGAGFLANMKQVRKSFKIERLEHKDPEFFRLKLIPLKASVDISEILLLISRETYRVVQVITYNAYKDETRITLSQITFNRNPDDALFKLEVPEGTDILQFDETPAPPPDTDGN